MNPGIHVDEHTQNKIKLKFINKTKASEMAQQVNHHA